MRQAGQKCRKQIAIATPTKRSWRNGTAGSEFEPEFEISGV